ncbi:MAG: YHS domain-containing protein [Alphaproteobacteria bacterium]|nr:MAG: YHS domain-containing protein [Alphaproteobacteria bacterium]
MNTVEKTSVAASSELHCAITDEGIASVKDAAGSEVYNGKTYYFCCPGCVTKFKADPAKYAVDADKRAAARKN